MSDLSNGLTLGEFSETFANLIADLVFDRLSPLFIQEIDDPMIRRFTATGAEITNHPQESALQSSLDADKEYLTAAQLAKTLHTTVETIYRNPSRFPKIKNGRRNLYHLPTILKTLTPKPPKKSGLIYTHKIGATRAVTSPKHHTTRKPKKPSIKPTTLAIKS